jgi:hypothetical protein
MRFVQHASMFLHVSPRPIALANHKVPTRVVIPSHIEVPARIVVEVYIGKVVRPVLDSIEAILTFFQMGLRGSAHNGSSRKHSKRQEMHDVFDERKWPTLRFLSECNGLLLHALRSFIASCWGKKTSTCELAQWR